jgi:SpoVK/Ycf46/Vps4 family AAA+-type ATPase
MDGLNEQSHTTIIGSTNVDKSLLDPWFMRPGRFDKKLSIDTPETDTLKKLWIHKLSTCMQEKWKYFNPEIVSLSPQAFEVFVDENLMTLSKWFTGADIEKGIVEPLINHSIKNDVLLWYDDIITFTEKHKKIK